MIRHYTLALAAALLTACDGNTPLCTDPETPNRIAGDCHGDTAALAILVGYTVVVALVVWVVATLAGIRADVRRAANALERREGRDD